MILRKGRALVSSTGSLRSLLDDEPLSGVDGFDFLHFVQSRELRDAHIVLPRDLVEVVAPFDHIDFPDRFPEILLKDVLFPLGDFDSIATARDRRLPDLRVELPDDLKVGLRCVSNGF